MFDDDLPESQYAPLVDGEVHSVVLDVYTLETGKWKPVYDRDGDLIQMLPGEGVRELSSRIVHAGLYRVVARDPSNARMLRRKDWSLRPISAPGRPAPPPAATMSGEIIELYKAQVEQAHKQREEAIEQLRAERDRTDAMLTAERQRTASIEGMARERVEQAKEGAGEAKILVAGLTARLEAREQRVAELEAQLEDMKTEVQNARDLAAELKAKAEDSEFSPLDAIMQMDQALDVLGKTAERFENK